MPVLIDEAIVTPETLLALNDDDAHCELIDGHLVEKEMGFRASRIAFVLAWFLEAYLRNGDRGIAVTEGSFDCFPIAKRTVRIPDAAIILNGRFANGEIPDGHSSIAPDIAIEVISPNETVYDSSRKVTEYLAAGVKEVWSVNPDQKTLSIRRPGLPTTELDETGTLTSDLLPGFSLRVSEIFQ